MPVNFEMAKKLFEKAAQQEVYKEAQGNARTMLGEMYYLACGVKKDCNKAIEFFAKAEEHASDWHKEANIVLITNKQKMLEICLLK